MPVSDFDTYANLIIIDMVDFEVILGMDWLPHHHAVMDCFAKTVTLYMLSIPPIMWKGAIIRMRMGIIS